MGLCACVPPYPIQRLQKHMSNWWGVKSQEDPSLQLQLNLYTLMEDPYGGLKRMPRFATKAEADACPAPGFPLLTTWRQVCKELLPQIGKLSGPLVGAGHCPDAGLNTLRYLFFHTRCGVWVSIRDNKVVLFTPFANVDFRNNYGHRIKCTEAGLDPGAYAALKGSVTRRRPEAVEPDVHRWWLNGGIVCNVIPHNVWGTSTWLRCETCWMRHVACSRFPTLTSP